MTEQCSDDDGLARGCGVCGVAVGRWFGWSA